MFIAPNVWPHSSYISTLPRSRLGSQCGVLRVAKVRLVERHAAGGEVVAKFINSRKLRFHDSGYLVTARLRQRRLGISQANIHDVGVGYREADPACKTDSFAFDDFDPLRPGGSDWNVWMIRFIPPLTVAFFPVLPVL